MESAIIGRTKEIQALKQYYHSGKAEFVALYGRRRVGKTFLVRQLFENRLTFDMTGIMEGAKADQLTAFHTAMKACGYRGKKAVTWLDAFFALRELLSQKMVKGERCLIFIDELPCFDTPKAGFVNALGHFWNSWANWQPEIMLIVCGSATSWMVRNVIDNHGGLHDRITHEILLRPFTLSETEAFFKANGFLWERISIVQAYMAMGGIPYYLGLFQRNESPAQGIDRLFFSEQGELRKEYRRLFSSLFRTPAPYLQIIDALAKHPQGLTRTQLAEATGICNNGNLGDMLTDLVYCDFLCKNPVRKKKVSTTSAIFQLVDFYTIFYKSFVENAGVRHQFWSLNVGKPEINTWYGLAYERVCKAHIREIKQALGIVGVSTECYSWRSKASVPGAQIDLIIDRADGIINLCEVKYSDATYTLNKEEYLKIMHRRNVFRTETGVTKTIIPTLITTFGQAEGMYGAQITTSITLDHLFASPLFF
ncbi:MAG: ATP-binding protein [Sodaliphilus sp.]